MNYLIKNALIVNEGKTIPSDILIKNERIERIDPTISVNYKIEEIQAEGLYLMPGIIDDQVHFREPGLTYKEDIYHGSKAAVAGGVTSFMDMPNVNPPSLTQQLLEERYQLATKTSLANFSFYMGVSNDNAEEVLKTNPSNVCGIKIFMGSSTGNLLVDDEHTLSKIFRNAPTLIATHCEDEQTIRNNLEKFKAVYGDNIPVQLHPMIRNEEACFKSSSHAVELAKKHDTRLHVLHISTRDELPLFSNSIPLEQKRITAEVCVHHLYFDDQDYKELGSKIKWNPAIKNGIHKQQLMLALLDGTLDVIATDHAPHTWEEKQKPYTSCPSGAPMIQHSLNIMLHFYNETRYLPVGKGMTLETIAEKMSHNVATCFKIKDRGFIREGYYADLFLLDLHKEFIVSKENILYKCGWSPLEGKTFKGKVVKTFVNGNVVYDNGNFNEDTRGQRMLFYI
ncbi:MAG: dihydroorotase [Fimbriimonadaceae bacterium]|nr:dihydroorotase [Chitinophagales bacterium]